MNPKTFYVYILTNYKNTVLYVGVTSNLIQRIWQHKQKFVHGFTAKYNLNKLVYYEMYNNSQDAIAREKQLKDMRRERKVSLIEQANPQWQDLYPNLTK